MSGPALLFILLAFGFLYLVLIRPQRRRRLEQEQRLSEIQPGVEVLTAGGIYGTVVSLADDEVTVEIAPGTEVRIARRAIAGVVPQDDEDEDESDLDEEPDHDEAPDELEAPDHDEEPAELSDESEQQAAEPDRA
jgi:preprotein translocase subunit YajC